MKYSALCVVTWKYSKTPPERFVCPSVEGGHGRKLSIMAREAQCGILAVFYADTQKKKMIVEQLLGLTKATAWNGLIMNCVNKLQWREE